jgi:hypothetical protein
MRMPRFCEGADKIQLTVNAGDVATCKAMGNIKTPEAASSPKNSFVIGRLVLGVTQRW